MKEERYYIAIGIDVGYKRSFAIVIQQRYKDGRIKVIYMDIFDPSQGSKNRVSILDNISEYLNHILGDITSRPKLLKLLRLVAIEEQPPYTKKILTCIEQHCLTFFKVISYIYNIPTRIILVNSRSKYTIHGMNGKSSDKRKEWASRYIQEQLPLTCGRYMNDMIYRLRYDERLARNCGDAFLLIEASLHSLHD